MKTLITADLHLSANPRDAYRLDTMEHLAKVAKREGITQTCILGDLTEEKDRHTDWLTNKVVEVVRRFSQLGPVYINQGNHDSYSDPDCPFFHFLRHMPQVRWYGKPTAERTPGLGRVLWLPHARNWKEAWADVSFKDQDIVFAHGMFVGAKLGNGREADRSQIPIRLIPSTGCCIAGDVHIPQKVSSAIEYVGAPYTVDFGDAYAARAIVFDAMGRRGKDIPLEGRPQKCLLEFDGSERELQRIDRLNEGDILKIRVALSRKDAPRWPEARDKLRKHYTEIGMIVHSIVPVITEEPGARVRIGPMGSSKSDEQIFDEFARHRGVDKRTQKIGERLL